jgi:hemolysin III
MHIRQHSDASLKMFFKRTVSAQLHLLALIAAIVGLVILVQLAGLKHNRADFFACLAFGITGIMVFLASTVYHFISDGFQISDALELKLKNLDHFAIFLFIAGTYSPVMLNVVNPPWNWLLIGVVWFLGLAGILYTLLKERLPQWARHRAVNTGLFVLMGWTLIVRVSEAFSHMSAQAIWLLALGGISYTIGAVIYALKKPNFFQGVFGFHELWHIMVMIGFGCHYFLILGFYR